MIQHKYRLVFPIQSRSKNVVSVLKYQDYLRIDDLKIKMPHIEYTQVLPNSASRWYSDDSLD